MGFNWSEYLNLAQFLSGSVSSVYTKEAAERCAVSRAYYAAYCLARNFARANFGFEPTNLGKDHVDVRKIFRSKGYIAVAKDLDDLRNFRNMCDYHDNVSDLNCILTAAIKKAQNVIKLS